MMSLNYVDINIAGKYQIGKETDNAEGESTTDDNKSL